MIPYEELVIALQTWRAKQGLPVGMLSTAAVPPPASPPMATQRSGPPVAPPKSGSTGPQQALDVADDSLDVDDSALLEEAQYDPHALDDGESTSIGTAPSPRTSEPTLDDGDARPGSNRSRNEDW